MHNKFAFCCRTGNEVPWAKWPPRLTWLVKESWYQLQNQKLNNPTDEICALLILRSGVRQIRKDVSEQLIDPIFKGYWTTWLLKIEPESLSRNVGMELPFTLLKIPEEHRIHWHGGRSLKPSNHSYMWKPWIIQLYWIKFNENRCYLIENAMILRYTGQPSSLVGL
jgi:hypothetical protein